MTLSCDIHLNLEEKRLIGWTCSEVFNPVLSLIEEINESKTYLSDEEHRRKSGELVLFDENEKPVPQFGTILKDETLGVLD